MRAKCPGEFDVVWPRALACIGTLHSHLCYLERGSPLLVSSSLHHPSPPLFFYTLQLCLGYAVVLLQI